MGRDLSIENPEVCFFGTTRTAGSRLWFINNPVLQKHILAYLALYQERYEVIIYAFIIMGNHYHLLARFPNANKAAFYRDFNGIVSKLTNRHIEHYDSAKLWARRVRSQVVPRAIDVEDRFFYASLNPVGAGLVQKVSEYTGYNSFSDAIYDRRKKYQIVRRQDFEARRKCDPTVSIADFTSEHILTFSRLPGHEALSQKAYAKWMLSELETRRQEVIRDRLKEGKGFATREALLNQKVGARPRTTKTSTRTSFRPLVLTRCLETKQVCLDWYFSILSAFKSASLKFRNGAFQTDFPPGTYRPWSICRASA